VPDAAALYDKSFSHFSPLRSLPAEESERHYRDVHAPFARRFLREMSQVVSYHTGRVTAELDLGGGWAQRPRGFRFIVLRYLSGRALELPEDLHERIAQDHRNFLRELRAFPVREQVLVDRLTGQTALEKYVVELDRPDGAAAAEAADRVRQLVDLMAEQSEGAFGLRQLLVNHVLGEGETVPIDEPGQRPLRQLLPQSTRQAVLEIYFDNHEWAEDWFRRPAVRGALLDPWWALARTSRVAEECGMDKR
jgi:hypothetical protein